MWDGIKSLRNPSDKKDKVTDIPKIDEEMNKLPPGMQKIFIFMHTHLISKFRLI